MMRVLEALIAAVEALTRNAASVGSPAHDLIAEAKEHFEAAKGQSQTEPLMPATPYEPPAAEPEEPVASAEQQPEEHS